MPQTQLLGNSAFSSNIVWTNNDANMAIADKKKNQMVTIQHAFNGRGSIELGWVRSNEKRKNGLLNELLEAAINIVNRLRSKQRT